MNTKTNEAKTPMSRERMYKFMTYVVAAVASAFLIKNLASAAWGAAACIGICLVVYVAVLYVMKFKNVKTDIREVALSISLCFLIFVISLFSGEYYSDDFPMFLAAIGLCGLYLEPKVTKAQIIISGILLTLMYVLHPEKAESLGQYIQCLVIMIVAGTLFYQTIKRGQAFLLISQDQAGESEKLLESMRVMGVNLQQDFEESSASIDASTSELQKGGALISQGANEMADNCNEVHDRIQVTERQIQGLNDGVMKFEQALGENQKNMEAMDSQMQKVAKIIEEANQVFQDMESRMRSVSKVAESLNDISFNITILSLNASIEAARAGDAGAGFDIVALRMRELSESSNEFSQQVEESIQQLAQRMEDTSKEFGESTQAIEESGKLLRDLQGSFERLTDQFADLYNNIEEQNSNVAQVDAIFGQLNRRVADMRNLSEDNQDAVEAIVDAMDIYKENISGVIEQTKMV